jgi:hypothetical protein
MSTQKTTTEYSHIGYKKIKSHETISFSTNNYFYNELKNEFYNFAGNSEVHVSFRDFCRMVFRLGFEAYRNGGSK